MASWRKIGVVIVTLVIVLPAIFLVSVNNKPANSTALHYTYSIVNVYPHDTNAFTEGLVFDSGFLYESTGLYGNSSLRRADLETGGVLQLLSLQPQYFGEGIAVVDDKIVQLTWQSHKGFVYDKTSFDLLQEFEYPTEGWGLAYDGKWLIMSDGTANLYFLDPVTLQRIGQVTVHDTGPVTELNELEYMNGTVYANVWREEKIAAINPQNGQVTAWIDLTGIQDLKNQDPNNVLNGIAYDANGDRLFVTGKMWPHIFEIKLIPSALAIDRAEELTESGLNMLISSERRQVLCYFLIQSQPICAEKPSVALPVTKQRVIKRGELKVERNRREGKMLGLTNKNLPARALRTGWRECRKALLGRAQMNGWRV